MSELGDVSPIGQFSGMSVLSLSTGNRLGQIQDVVIDPINGVLLGVVLTLTDGGEAGLPIEEIYNFGRDAVMARTDRSFAALDSGVLGGGQPASKLIGTEIITDSGAMLGHITNVFVTLQPPPHILYEVRQSLLDKLLGREFFVPASIAHALSDDGARLVVPDVTSEIASSDLESLLGQQIEVRTFGSGGQSRSFLKDNDETIPVMMDEDETIVRIDDDETLVRARDDDDTVVRDPA